MKRRNSPPDDASVKSLLSSSYPYKALWEHRKRASQADYSRLSSGIITQKKPKLQMTRLDDLDLVMYSRLAAIKKPHRALKSSVRLYNSLYLTMDDLRALQMWSARTPWWLASVQVIISTSISIILGSTFSRRWFLSFQALLFVVVRLTTGPTVQSDHNIVIR